MADPRTAWGEVGDRLSALALKLKLHADEELSDEELHRRVGLDRITTTVRETFDALEDAAEDEAVRADLRDAGQSFLSAIDATVDEIRRRIERGTT